MREFIDRHLTGFSIVVLALCCLSICLSNHKYKQTKKTEVYFVSAFDKYTYTEAKYDINALKNVKEIEVSGITITSYNNKTSQTDSTPNIMASNRLVYEGAVAVSQDLKNLYKLNFGDLIYIQKPIGHRKVFVIEDVMNKRFTKRIDIFDFDENYSRTVHLKNQTINILKIGRNQ